MTLPTLVKGKDPVYTREALAKRVEGLIVARCNLTTEGEVKNCFVLKSIPLMDGPVLDALMQQRYTPALLDGKPVLVNFIFNVTLRLPTR